MTESELKAVVQTNIKRYREYRKWTQAQFAEKLNISINFLSDIENGKKWISPATMVKFASVLNIEPFELFKPIEAVAPDVSALFSRYNDEVVQAVSESVKHVYNFYQAIIDDKLDSGAENAKIPEKSDDASFYDNQQESEYRELTAEQTKDEII